MTEHAPKPSKPPKTARRRRRRQRKRRGKAFARVVAALGILATLAASALVWWASRPGPSRGRLVALDAAADASAASTARLLTEKGLTTSPRLMTVWLAVASVVARPEPGPHLLSDRATPWELLRRLSRLGSRERAHVVIPEGYNMFQVAERLEQKEVCDKATFLAAARDPRQLTPLGVPGASAEGYLFPATYDLYADSRAGDVLAIMVREAKRRFQVLAGKYAVAMQRLRDRYDWSEHDVLTLASIVEKEAAGPQEQPLVASVFFNRLENVEFRPAKMLQSDPTAAYGCLLDPSLASCSAYMGRVLAPMLRDGSNPYNTYRHPGLPPGPIASPGERAIEAVLNPARTDYLFFFANGNGHHVFSRNLAEHEAAIGPVRNRVFSPDPPRANP